MFWGVSTDRPHCVIADLLIIVFFAPSYIIQTDVGTDIFKDTGYPHDGRADKDSYPHDGRADKDSYPHDGRADKDSYPHDRHNQCIMLSL